jgi:hypothetical protein
MMIKDRGLRDGRPAPIGSPRGRSVHTAWVRSRRRELGWLLFVVLAATGCANSTQDQSGEGDFVCQAVCRLPDGTLQPGASRRFDGAGKEEAQLACERSLTGGGTELCVAPAAFSGRCNCTLQPQDDADLPIPVR